MTSYEIGFIVAPDASEDEVKRISEQIQSLLQKENAQEVHLDLWGLKPLAYPIKKFREGYYVFFDCKALPATIINVEKRLRQFEKVVRFITLKLDERMRKANRLTRKWARAEKMRKREIESDAVGGELEAIAKEVEDEN